MPVWMGTSDDDDVHVDRWMQAGCGCLFEPVCCLCMAQQPNCYPNHFVEGRWLAKGNWRWRRDCKLHTPTGRRPFVESLYVMVPSATAYEVLEAADPDRDWRGRMRMGETAWTRAFPSLEVC
jgi:hypothetical protein